MLANTKNYHISYTLEYQYPEKNETVPSLCLPISNAVHIACESAIQCIVAVVIEKASNGIPSIPCSLIARVSTGDQYLIVLYVMFDF